MKGAASALRYPTVEAFEQDFTTKIGITEQGEGGGISALDDDDVFKFGDFREAFKENPIATLRIAFRALRGGKAQAQTEAPGSDPRLEQLKALGLKVRIDDADTALLLPLYDPAKASDPVTNVLKKRFGDKKLIAFTDDGKVAIQETLRYISDVEQGYPEAESGAIMVNGRLTELWAVGTKPERMVEEDPLFPGKPLRDGCSIVNGRNWSKVDHNTRQFVRVIVDLGHINVDNRDAVLRLLERATEKTLGDAYPEAELEYRKLAKKDALPKLKVELGSTATKSNNPFGINRQY